VAMASQRGVPLGKKWNKGLGEKTNAQAKKRNKNLKKGGGGTGMCSTQWMGERRSEMKKGGVITLVSAGEKGGKKSESEWKNIK